jgi:hypothetical protein
MFIATSPSRFPVWPLGADERYVVWSDEYCDNGRGRIYDRQTKKLIEADVPLWPVVTRRGLLLEGIFGGNAVIDLARFQYRTALPANVFDTAWSSDLRYASAGQAGGHGGVCG